MSVHICYAAFDVAGAVLYVGYSSRPLAVRAREHMMGVRDAPPKPWRGEVAVWRVVGTYTTERAGKRAEIGWILRLQPRFNIEHNRHNPHRVIPHVMRYAATGKPYRPDLYPQPFRWNPRPAPKPHRARRPVRRRSRRQWADLAVPVTLTLAAAWLVMMWALMASRRG